MNCVMSIDLIFQFNDAKSRTAQTSCCKRNQRLVSFPLVTRKTRNFFMIAKAILIGYLLLGLLYWLHVAGRCGEAWYIHPTCSGKAGEYGCGRL